MLNKLNLATNLSMLTSAGFGACIAVCALNHTRKDHGSTSAICEDICAYAFVGATLIATLCMAVEISVQKQATERTSVCTDLQRCSPSTLLATTSMLAYFGLGLANVLCIAKETHSPNTFLCRDQCMVFFMLSSLTMFTLLGIHLKNAKNEVKNRDARTRLIIAEYEAAGLYPPQIPVPTTTTTHTQPSVNSMASTGFTTSAKQSSLFTVNPVTPQTDTKYSAVV